MGGRLDSTNVVHPLLSIITSISFDHTRQLGNTLGADRDREGRDPQAGPAGRQRRAGAARRSSPSAGWPPCGAAACTSWAPTSASTRSRPTARDPSHALPGRRPDLADRLGDVRASRCWDRTRPTTRRSPWRASTSWPRSSRGWPSAATTWPGASPTLKWPARVEILGHRPCLVIDGAHNGASAVALAETLRTCFPPTRRTLVFGTTRDKDLQGQLQALLPSVRRGHRHPIPGEPAVAVPRDDRRRRC